VCSPETRPFGKRIIERVQCVYGGQSVFTLRIVQVRKPKVMEPAGGAISAFKGVKDNSMGIVHSHAASPPLAISMSETMA
jgi:hypothetical protein